MWNKVTKYIGCLVFHGKWIVGWLLNMGMNVEENDFEWSSYNISWGKHELSLNDQCITLSPVTNLRNIFFYLELGKSNVDWELRANLRVK